jgi:Family of unknown function (DUF5690)
MQEQMVRGFMSTRITRWLNSSPVVFVLYASICAFAVYSCMYGFRKPYTVGLYSDTPFQGIAYKVCLVIAQVLGYMLSKFYGIRFIAAMKPQRRPLFILLFIGIAWLSLLLFALIPPPYNMICMFINGLPLGMVFGLVLGFLEGRRTTELMGAILATSFIFASGLAKTTGKWLLLKMEVSEWWMPFAAGSVFVVPLILFVWLLAQVPPPSPEDIEHRTERKPMTGPERMELLRRFGTTLIPVVIAYTVFTIARDFCEDFANELWTETGYKNDAGIFAKVSTITSVITLAIVGAFFLIKDNYKAFKMTHWLVIGGVLLGVVATLLFRFQFISPVIWMIMATTGLYLAYIPFNCLFFERMIATYKIRGNMGFIMYIADAFGYLGTVAVLMIKEFMTVKYSWVNFFSFLFYSAGIIGVLLLLFSLNIHTKLHQRLWKKGQPL